MSITVVSNPARVPMCARILLSGPPKSGKTTRALILADALNKASGGGKTLLLQVEPNGDNRARGKWQYDLAQWQMQTWPVSGLLTWLKEAYALPGYSTYILDGAEKFHHGAGGILSTSKSAPRQKQGLPIWQEITEGQTDPLYQMFLDCPGNLIVTAQAKVKSTQMKVKKRNESGQEYEASEVVNLGLRAKFRSDIAERMEFFMMLDGNHRLELRQCREYPDFPMPEINPTTAAQFVKWLGVPEIAKSIKAQEGGEVIEIHVRSQKEAKGFMWLEGDNERLKVPIGVAVAGKLPVDPGYRVKATAHPIGEDGGKSVFEASRVEVAE